MPGLKNFYLPVTRKHVRAGARWNHEIGTDYWLQPAPALDQAGVASTATGDELAENGWVATSLVNTGGSGADFGAGALGTADKGTPNHFLTNASGDLLKSPVLFGSYDHMWGASRVAGMKSLPTDLVAEFWGAMTVHTADEPTSGWGFVEDGGTPATEADQLAWISSDGTNFQIGTNAGTPVNGAVDDALWHLFEIRIRRDADGVAKAYWSIDGGADQAVAGLAITNDEFPVSFGFHALTTNRPALGLTHVYYDWSKR